MFWVWRWSIWFSWLYLDYYISNIFPRQILSFQISPWTGPKSYLPFVSRVSSLIFAKHLFHPSILISHPNVHFTFTIISQSTFEPNSTPQELKFALGPTRSDHALISPPDYHPHSWTNPVRKNFLFQTGSRKSSHSTITISCNLCVWWSPSWSFKSQIRIWVCRIRSRHQEISDNLTEYRSNWEKCSCHRWSDDGGGEHGGGFQSFH